MSKEQLYHYNDTIDQLQQENEELKEELAEKEKHIIGQNALLNKSKETNNQLKQQLAEKDKEIDILTVGLQIANQYGKEIYNKYAKDNKKHLRHEICEKIRKQIHSSYIKEPMICSPDGDVVLACIYISTADKILDQIERGDE